MKNKFVAHAIAFSRTQTKAPVAKSPASVDNQLAAALNQIQDLESRLEKLEAALSVEPNGDVELFASGALRLISSTRVEISGTQSVSLSDGQTNTLKLDASGVASSTGAKFKVDCSTYEVSSAMSKVNTAMAEFSGVVKCDTILANTVSGATYTPGAGNMM